MHMDASVALEVIYSDAPLRARACTIRTWSSNDIWLFPAAPQAAWVQISLPEYVPKCPFARIVANRFLSLLDIELGALNWHDKCWLSGDNQVRKRVVSQMTFEMNRRPEARALYSR